MNTNYESIEVLLFDLPIPDYTKLLESGYGKNDK